VVLKESVADAVCEGVLLGDGVGVCVIDMVLEELPLGVSGPDGGGDVDAVTVPDVENVGVRVDETRKLVLGVPVTDVAPEPDTVRLREPLRD
jgi:hypothetical protein